MTILIIVLFILLFVIVYGALFVKKLLEEIDVKEQLIFNLKKALQEEQDKSMNLSRSIQVLTASKRLENSDTNCSLSK